MGSSRALVCSTAFVLVLLSSASQDEHNDGQRELTFDHDKTLQEMQRPDSFMYQRPLDLSEMLSPEEIQMMEQRPLDHEGNPMSPAKRRSNFRPRSFGALPAQQYPVQFPLARPSSDNLPAICLHGDQRPLYPGSYFPPSGFGQLRRKARAVNNAESWFRSCCQQKETSGEEVALCCATQAWELSVNSFCEEDQSVKDLLYECCYDRGSDRFNCFDSDAPNPSYGPTEELPVPPLPSTSTDSFSFDPNTCQGQRSTQQLLKDTIHHLCSYAEDIFRRFSSSF